MEALFFWLVMIYLILWIYSGYRDFMAPVIVSVGVWGTALGLYYLKLIAYDDLTGRTLAVIGVGVLGFIGAGLLVGHMTKLDRRAAVVSPKADLQARVVPERFFALISVSFVAGMIGQVLFLREVERVLGIRYALQNPELFHFQLAAGELKSLGIVSLLATTNVVNFVLLVAFLTLFNDHRLAKFAWLQLLLTFVAVLFRTNRTAIFLPILWSMITYFYINGGAKFSRRRIMMLSATLATLLLVFVGLAISLGKDQGSGEIRRFWHQDVPYNGAVASVYHYATSALPAFQVLIEGNDDLLYGRSTFLPFLRFAQIFDPEVSLLTTQRDPVLVPVQTNVFTYLAPFYEDFGVLGVFIMTSIVGGIFMLLYSRIRRGVNVSIAVLLVASLATTTVFWSVFQSIIIFIVVWYYGILAFAIGFLATKRQDVKTLAQVRGKRGLRAPQAPRLPARGAK